MGNLRTSFLSVSAGVLGLAACGSKNTATVDAPPVVLIDAAPDAKAIDAFVPDAPPVYDFSCATATLPTTAVDPVTVSGTTDQLSLQGLAALPGATVKSFKLGTVAPIDTVVSAAGTGAYTTGNLVTGGTPLDGYVSGSIADAGATKFRTTFVFPPDPLVANIPNAPIPMATTSTFGTLTSLAQVTQDDTVNGAMLIGVLDCANTPIVGATLSVQQAAADVGQQFDLGALSSMAAGLFFVFNVPDGNTDIGATFQGMTFRTHQIISFKKSDGALNGTLSASFVRPGP